MFNPLTLLYLVAGHAICDYPLQGDFLAKGKNHRNPLPGVPWYQCLFAHAVIHGGMVALITRSFTLGMCEFTVHFVTDWCKSEGKLTFNQDQTVHYACKLAWWLLS